MGSFCLYCGARLTRPGAQYCQVCGQKQVQAASPGSATVAISLPGNAGIAAASARPHLVIQSPGQPPRVAALANGMTTLGREADNTVVLPDMSVSRHHAQIEQRAAEYWLSDLGSANGTSVNGQSLRRGQEHRLNDNDIIRIGDQQGNSVGITFGWAANAGPAAGAVRLGKLKLEGLPAYGLGRDPSNQLHLDHPSVSRRHARIEQTAKGRIIRDLGSANGTWIQGQLLRGDYVLQPGDVIQIGPFRLVYDTAGISQVALARDYHLDGIGLRRWVPQPRKLTRAVIVENFRWLTRPTGLPPLMIPARRLILDNVSISVQPKDFVALVGGSGAGKTTLMNALSGFAPAEGTVLLNGDDLYANFAAYRSTLGYVPQDDIIHGKLTARSALNYSARLRLPDATAQEISQRVTDALAQVEMTEHADSKPVDKLSGGQRKRVSIAVELLADPGLFFLDEPTSGLDPGLEKKMMYTLRRLADSGRTIVLVTHATANIHQCTHVAFMADAKLAFFGPPAEAESFFGIPQTSAHDFSDIYTRLSQPLDSLNNPPPPGYQLPPPPTAPPTAAEAWADYYRTSPQYRQYVAGRQSAAVNSQIGNKVLAQQQNIRPTVSRFQQFGVLSQRYFELIRRDMMSLFTLLVVMPIIGLLLLMMAKPHDLVGQTPADVRISIQQKIADQQDQQDPAMDDERFAASYGVAGSAQKLLFMLALAANLLGMFAAAYEIIKEEAIFRRERMVNLEIMPYLGSKLVVLAGFALVQCALLLAIIRLRVHFPQDGVLLSATLEIYITLFLAALAGITLGLLISAAVRSSSAVIYIVLLILFIQIIFSGAIFELPATVKPISYLTATRWTLEALGGTVDMERLKQTEATCIEFEDERTGSVLGVPLEPCEQGQMRQASSYDFNVTYRHTSGQLLLRWGVLVIYSMILIALTWVIQRRKDLV